MDEVLYKGKWLTLKQRNGWEYVEREGNPPIVAMLAVTKDHQILLVEQWREPLQCYTIELPCGLVDSKEPLVDAAKRELLEETGYQAGHVEKLYSTASSSGLSNERITVYRMYDCEKVAEGGGVDGENIKVHAIYADEIFYWLSNRASIGDVIDSKIYAAFYHLTSD